MTAEMDKTSFANENQELTFLRQQIRDIILASERSRLALLSILEDEKEARESFKTQGEQYHTLVESMNEGLIQVDNGDRIQFVNDRFCQLSGYAREELVGKIGQKMMFDPADREVIKQKNQLRLERKSDEYEIRLHRKDGQYRWVHVSGAPVTGPDGKVTGSIGVFTDITEHKQAEALQQALFQISDVAIGCRDLQQLYIQIHKTISKLMPAKNLYIALYDEKSGSLSFPYYRDQKNDYKAPRRFGKGLTEYIITTKIPLLVNKQVHDQLQDEGKAEFVGQPSKQWLGVPLQSENKTYGALVVQSYDEKTEYTQKDLDLLNYVAGHVAVAISSTQASQVIRESQEKYRDLVENINDVVFSVEADGTMSYISPAIKQVAGYSPEEIVGKNFLEFIHPNDREMMNGELKRKLSGEQHITEYRVIAKDGSIRWVSSSSRIFIEGGKPAGLNGLMIDITERRKNEELIRFMARALESINECVTVSDLEGRITFVNQTFLNTYGYQQDEVIGRTSELVRVPGTGPTLPETTAATLQGGWRGELVNRRKDGSEFPVLLSTAPIRSETGAIVGLLGIAQDITEHKKADETLKASETRYRRLFESAKDGILILNAETGVIEDANPFIKGLLGYPREELIGKELWEIGLFKDIMASRDSFTELKKKEYVRYEDLPLQTKDGLKKEVEFVSNVYPVGDHDVVQCNIRDISERVRAEAQIKLAAKKWETTFDSINDGICLLDRQGKISQCNLAFSRLVKKPYDQILGRACHGLVHGLDQPVDRCPVARMEASLHRETLELEREGRRLLITVDPILDQKKELLGAVHTISDITDRKLMEQELLQAQKMEAVGFLAGGVAHDFNNMLAGILGNAELLQLKIFGQKELESYLDNIIKATGHAAGLTKQLLAFARKGQYHQVPINIHKVIAETLGILGNTIDRRIKIEQHLKANPAVILGDYSQLENAFMNLGINARDAMPQGGKLIFSTDLANLDQEYISQHNYKIEPGAYVRVSVDDTGCGMTEEVKRQLFEPFFTTKGKGLGTGLGLAGVYGCVKNHGGSIAVYSETGRGTAVKIYLPLYGDPGSLDQGSDQLQCLPATAGTGSILIVDDENMIRTIAAQILKTAGYRVQTCADGQEAVELYARDHGSIDLVIMDMVMPKLDGREAYSQMRIVNPKVKVLLSSGFSEDGDAQAILKDGAQGFIQKPYRSAELLQRVQQALQSTNSNEQ